MPSNKSKQSSAGDDVYEMEAIIDYKQEKKVDFYKIKWKNYDLQDATWEPRKNIINPDEPQRKLMRDLKNKWLSQIVKEENSSSSQPPTNNYSTNDSASAKIFSDLGTPVPPSDDNEENGSPNIEATNKPKKVEKRPLSQIDSNTTAAMEEQKNDEKVISEPKVKHIRAMSGVPYALMDVPTVNNSIKRLCLSVTEARESYSEALLDYLLQRMRFKENSNAATSPTPPV